MPRDKETYRGTTKPFYPPHNARLQVKCPIKNDPAMAATRAAIRDIYGNFFSTQICKFNKQMI